MLKLKKNFQKSAKTGKKKILSSKELKKNISVLFKTKLLAYHKIFFCGLHFYKKLAIINSRTILKPKVIINKKCFSSNLK